MVLQEIQEELEVAVTSSLVIVGTLDCFGFFFLLCLFSCLRYLYFFLY